MRTTPTALAITWLICISLTACTLSNKNSTNSRTEQEKTGHQQLSTTTLYPSLGIEKTIFFSEYGDTTAVDYIMDNQAVSVSYLGDTLEYNFVITDTNEEVYFNDYIKVLKNKDVVVEESEFLAFKEKEDTLYVDLIGPEFLFIPFDPSATTPKELSRKVPLPIKIPSVEMDGFDLEIRIGRIHTDEVGDTFLVVRDLIISPQERLIFQEFLGLNDILDEHLAKNTLQLAAPHQNSSFTTRSGGKPMKSSSPLISNNE